MSLRPIDEQIWLELNPDRPLTQADIDLLNAEEDEFRAAVAPRDDRPSLGESIFLLIGLEIGACVIILLLCVQILGGFE